jgi:uncharacterized protein YbbC (DUF1343 family)
MHLKYISTFVLLIFGIYNIVFAIPADFKLGNEVLLEERLDFLKSKNTAIITNQTGILSDGRHMVDVLLEKDVRVVKIFTPEHGIRGDEKYTGKDKRTGIHIISLYGDKVKPSADDLKDVDVLVYDIQDVGARFYTYTTTLYYVIESAIENNKKLIVCDRPVMINPNYVDGFMLEEAYSSFVGKIPVPVCYGMTCGELAVYLKDDINFRSEVLEVVLMKNYSHSTDYSSLSLTWVKPSPNMFFPSTAQVYAASCFLEGTNVSEGRGTEKPFEYIGAPWCDGERLANELNSYNIEGVVFEALTFTPTEKISAYPPKYFGKSCSGVFIKVVDDNKFEPVKAGVAMLVSLKKLFADFKFNKDNYIDKLAGTNRLREMVDSGSDAELISNSWKDDLIQFKNLRSQYLMYK